MIWLSTLFRQALLFFWKKSHIYLISPRQRLSVRMAHPTVLCRLSVRMGHPAVWCGGCRCARRTLRFCVEVIGAHGASCGFVRVIGAHGAPYGLVRVIGAHGAPCGLVRVIGAHGAPYGLVWRLSVRAAHRAVWCAGYRCAWRTWCRVRRAHRDDRQPTAWDSLKIGRINELTIRPTTPPITINMMGSTILEKAASFLASSRS